MGKDLKKLDSRHMEHIKNTFLKNIGAVIKKHREEQNISQRTLKDALGFKDHTIISDYEKGNADIPASMMAKISVLLKFPLEEYTEDISKKTLGEKGVPIDHALIKFNEMVRTETIEKERNKPIPMPSDAPDNLRISFQDFMTTTTEPRQMTLQDYLSPMKPQEPVPPPKPKLKLNEQTNEWEMVEQPLKQRKEKDKSRPYMTEDELADTQMLLQQEVEKMPLDKKASVQAIYQAIAAQIEEVQGDDGKEITAIAKATLKFAMKDVPPKKRKKIQAYLDVMADGNLAYKYNEWAYEQYGDRLERGLEEMRNDPEFEEYNKNNSW